jgi:hypothetical protein
MTTLREAAQQALEALDAYSWEQVDAARAALRAALSEPEQDEHDLTTVYMAGRMDEQKVQRKPLTDEEIAAISAECAASAYRWNDFEFARAIERAHGIGGES